MRVAVSTVLVAVIAATAVAFAAGSGLASAPVGAGAASVPRCHTGSVTVSYVGAPSTVTAVTVSGLSSVCNGGVLRLVVRNAAGTSVSSGSQTVASGSATVTLSPSVTAVNARSVRMVVIGP